VVGLEAHVTRALDSIDDRAKQMMMESNRSHGLREMILCLPSSWCALDPRRLRRADRQVSNGLLITKALTVRTGQKSWRGRVWCY
jgi:hypothetical protein